MIEQLIAYQKEDFNLKQIENKLSGSEERKIAVNAKKYIESATESVNLLDVKAEQLVIGLEKAKEEQKKFKEQYEELSSALSTVQDENEATFLVKKAEELIAKIKSISNEITKLSTDMQNVLTDYANTRKKVKTAQAQYAENGQKYNDLKASVQAEKSAIESKLEALKKEVDPDLMAKYMKKRDGKMYPIVYEVQDKSCGACNMELSMAELTKLKNGEIIECDQCGRLLYKK